MSDWTDEASELEELQTRTAIEHQREMGEKLREALEASTGFCLNCEEELATGRYCDADCRQDHERRMLNRR